MTTVFISHRGEDTDAAERLASALRRRGHEVWLDVWNVSIGDSIVECINEGLSTSFYLVLCYSDAGVSAPWVSREWMSALAQQLNGMPLKVLPVRLSGGSPPAIIADLKYADLVKDWTNGINDLCAAIR